MNFVSPLHKYLEDEHPAATEFLENDRKFPYAERGGDSEYHWSPTSEVSADLAGTRINSHSEAAKNRRTEA